MVSLLKTPILSPAPCSPTHPLLLPCFGISPTLWLRAFTGPRGPPTIDD
jgi:hypothetical protein